MRLRCRPGDLAVIVAESWFSPAIKGRLVHVESAAPVGVDFTMPNGQMHLAIGADYWVCRFVGGPVYVPYGFEPPWGKRLSSHTAIPDCCLRPIRPDAEPVDVETRKPLIGTVAANVLAHGTGALNIDGCRVPTDPAIDDPRLGGNGTWSSDKMAKNVYEGGYAGERVGSSPLGRWPANLIHDGSEEVVALFPREAGAFAPVRGTEPSSASKSVFGQINRHAANAFHGDTGSAARFFYCAKASKCDRGEANSHPTVKPTDLMRYLCRLVTPAGGAVLDPFAGSGSTLLAADREGFDAIGIELNPEYAEMARRRIHGDAPLFAEVAA